MVRADKFREFLHLLPNGFSYPTTSTMAFFRSAYPVAYVPIRVAKRVGTASHIRPLQGRRPLPADHLQDRHAVFAAEAVRAGRAWASSCSALGYYAYTYATQHRFTNMSALLLSAAVIVFLIGLVSEQITNLTYRRDA